VHPTRARRPIIDFMKGGRSRRSAQISGTLGQRRRAAIGSRAKRLL
jgi:hypothetical protein